MRAVFHSFDNHNVGDLVQITGDAAHHLNVIRVKQNENLLLLNGKGTKLVGTVESITKNQLQILINKVEAFSPEHNLSLAIAMPKKDAFEDILKMAVELGIKEIYPLTSEFSQHEYAPNERVQRVLESALIQSNNPFFPIIHAQDSLTHFLTQHHNTLVFFNSKKGEAENKLSKSSETTILIGPEGGFSSSEIEDISRFSKVLEIHLPTPILRAPTAVASSVGYLLALQ